MTDLIESIRDRQVKLAVQPSFGPLPRHQPEMLYIGCVDARLDPIDDIGIPKGKALIYRNIAALVRPAAETQLGPFDMPVTTGEIPESVSMGAVLEFFLDHIPAPKDRIKHIVISGHTHCGGIEACRDHKAKEGTYLQKYLSALGRALTTVLGLKIENDDAQLRALEKESVRQSLENLATYPSVRRAIDEKRVELHGWVIDTATQGIDELDGDGQFKPMSEIRLHGQYRPGGGSWTG